MDKFNKYALITVTVIVAVLLVSAYVSYQVGGNKATDDSVNAKASGSSSYRLLQSIHHRALGRPRRIRRLLRSRVRRRLWSWLHVPNGI